MRAKEHGSLTFFAIWREAGPPAVWLAFPGGLAGQDVASFAAVRHVGAHVTAGVRGNAVS